MNDGQGKPLSFVHAEAACDICHYLLKSQAVRRDEATGLLFVRCPECGAVHAAEALPPPTAFWRRWLSGRKQHFTVGAGALIVGGACVLHNLGVNDPDTIGEIIAMAATFFALLLTAAPLLYRFHALLRAGILLLAPATTALLSWSPGATSEILPTVLIIQASLAVGVAIGCRFILRGLVRACLPNASRYVFEDLWRIDDKLTPLGPW